MRGLAGRDFVEILNRFLDESGEPTF